MWSGVHTGGYHLGKFAQSPVLGWLQWSIVGDRSAAKRGRILCPSAEAPEFQRHLRTDDVAMLPHAHLHSLVPPLHWSRKSRVSGSGHRMLLVPSQKVKNQGSVAHVRTFSISCNFRFCLIMKCT
mgnify:CR=1 FL=1